MNRQIGDKDPGWRAAWKAAPSMSARMLLRRTKSVSNVNVLTECRGTFVGHAILTVAGCVAMLVLYGAPRGSHSTVLSIALVSLVGGLGLFAHRRIFRTLNCSSALMLAGSYRTRIFGRLAFASSAALAGSVMGGSVGPRWVSLIGAGFAVVGFWSAAPTRANLVRDQHELSLKGCQLSILAVLCGAR